MTKNIKKISVATVASPASLEGAIERASKGLVYISETDAEIIPFTGEKVETVTAAAVADMAEISSDEQVQETTIGDFFDRLIEPHDWWGDREKKRASRIAELRAALTSSLTELKVYRFGRIQIEIFIVGKDVEGRLAGIRTRAVET